MSYHEVESSIGDSNAIMTNQSDITLETLLPGRNYSITVQAVSKDQKSSEEVTIIYNYVVFFQLHEQEIIFLCFVKVHVMFT